MSEYYALNYQVPDYSPSTNYIYYADATNFTTGKDIEFPADDGLWQVFFNDYVNITESEYFSNPSYYQNLFEKYYREYFVENVSQGTSVSEVQGSSTLWKSFLNTSDIHKRQKSPFLWAFSMMLQMIPELQKSSTNAANRSEYLTRAQKAAVDTLGTAAYSLLVITVSSDYNSQQKNTERMADMQEVLGRKAISSGYADKASKHLQSAQSSNSQMTSLMSSLLQNVRDILNRLIQ